MLFFSPGSSEQTIAPPAPTPVVQDKLAALSIDEPLPETYRADRIRLLVQSPGKIYLYWELARDPFETLRRAFGAQAALYSLVLKFVDLESGEESLYQATPARNHWFNVLPGRAYRADVGLYAPGRSFIRLLSSNATRTPRASVARFADTTPEWNISANQFARALDDAGYVSDALEVMLEAADLETQQEATRAIARKFGGADVPLIDEEQLAELRSLLVALAMGVSYVDLRVNLSAPLTRWLERASHEQSAALESARLIEILRSMLGIEMSRATFDTLDELAMRRAARVILGASEVNLPARPFHLWLPSMNVGLKTRIQESGVRSQESVGKRLPPIHSES